MKKSKFLFVLLSFFMMSATTFAQKHTYTGVVVDETGEPVIGASVVQKGTSNGTVTDFDGNFSVSVDEGSTLVISYIGNITQEVKAADGLRIVMKSDSKLLDEVVVVGYGVQKKSVVTAAIAKVGADDLEGKGALRVDNALKGLAAGVNVTSASGQPGSSPKINIRGINSVYAGSEPLYIVDGMPIEGGIDYLNPSDIESIEVLKDAASGAVYGARAANGVILVTTKSGKVGKATVNYNFSMGWQNKWRKRDVLNATEYAVMMNEGRVVSGQDPYYTDPYNMTDVNGNPITTGTDWQDAVFNDNAPVINHELSVSGATDRINYYLSLGYNDQEGIVGGNYGRSNYNRLTLRSNTKYTLFDDTKDRAWLNKLSITSNVSYARIKNTSIGANSQIGSILGSALVAPPTLPVKLTDPTAIQNELDRWSANSTYTPLYDGAGNLYYTPGNAYHELINPVAALELPGTKNWQHRFVANFAADLSIGWGFNYRISYGAELVFGGYDGYTPLNYLSDNNKAVKSSAYSESNKQTSWQIENVLTWDKTFGDHSVNVVLGQSAKKWTGSYLGGSRANLIDYAKPYISYATGQAVDGDMGVYGGDNDEHTLASLFGRVSYNYAERYMFQATVRRDGSSRFGSNNHYATFPSFSLGWNVTNEPWFKKPNWLTNTKVRFSWGKNGNENIDNFRYAVYATQAYAHLFGRDNREVTGSKADGLANLDLKWEENEQIDLGVDFGFFNNALTFTFDYFKKTTNNMLMRMPIPAYVGESKPWGNVGEMENSGVEFELGYKFHIADAKFHVKGNASYLKNKVTSLGQTKYLSFDSAQGYGEISRAEVGQPFPYFYGYKTAGVFQTWDEIRSWVNSDGVMLQPNAVPGDLRKLDVDGSGAIDENDKTMIGKGSPDWSFGLSFNAEWKGFDFSMFWQGVAGVDIFDATYRTDIDIYNRPSWVLGRWSGEGTSSSIPRFDLADSSKNLESSDLFVHDGSYLRLKNIQLGYTIPQHITRKAFINRLRVYVAAENLVTFTKYHGYDPEMAPDGGTSLGIDYGAYPQARVWTIGVNVGF